MVAKHKFPILVKSFLYKSLHTIQTSKCFEGCSQYPHKLSPKNNIFLELLIFFKNISTETFILIFLICFQLQNENLSRKLKDEMDNRAEISEKWGIISED